jgi:hypothetical protein
MFFLLFWWWWGVGVGVVVEWGQDMARSKGMMGPYALLQVGFT